MFPADEKLIKGKGCIQLKEFHCFLKLPYTEPSQNKSHVLNSNRMNVDIL
jgi:hypothetical protein